MSISGPFQGIDLENLTSATPLVQPPLDSLRPEDYKLHQNYFTLDQLLTQETFQVVRSRDYLYFGGMQEGLRHGWGVLLGKGNCYEGSFSLGRKMGKGWLQSSSGAVFLGDFTNDRPHGQGLLSHGEEYYMGDFENGGMQGDGLWRNVGEKYVGKWQASRAHGHGIYTSELSHYQGNFHQFVKHGYGVELFPNGDQYRGNYLNGKPHGHGEYTWHSGAHYRGDFQFGMREGEGLWVSETGDEYRGHFSADRKNGQGEFRWSNGNWYRGEFCEDMREGRGEMQWSDGSMYEGEWKRGLPNGRGTFKAKGEKPRSGLFEDNILISQSRANMPEPRTSSNDPLGMIPEVAQRRKLTRKRGKSVNQSNSSTVGTFKVSKRTYPSWSTRK